MLTNKKWMMALGLFVVILMLVDLYFVFFYAPPEKYMGHVQKIMYFHISSAWVAFISFFIVFVMSIVYLIKKYEICDRIAKTCAEIGVLFTTFVLFTGPLWARPVWNTWWTWDPRLTTTLILWFIYVGYILLRKTTGNHITGKKVAAVFGIIGFLDVPIIHLSVKWWRSIHPSEVVSGGGMSMTPEMQITLIVSVITFLFIGLFLFSIRYKLETLLSQYFDLDLKQSIQERREKLS